MSKDEKPTTAALKDALSGMEAETLEVSDYVDPADTANSGCSTSSCSSSTCSSTSSTSSS